MSPTARASNKKLRRRLAHACVFDVGQVCELNDAARRIELFGKLIVDMLDEDEEWKEKGELLNELVSTAIQDATAIQALVDCGEKTAGRAEEV